MSSAPATLPTKTETAKDTTVAKKSDQKSKNRVKTPPPPPETAADSAVWFAVAFLTVLLSAYVIYVATQETNFAEAAEALCKTNPPANLPPMYLASTDKDSYAYLVFPVVQQLVASYWVSKGKKWPLVGISPSIVTEASWLSVGTNSVAEPFIFLNSKDYFQVEGYVNVVANTTVFMNFQGNNTQGSPFSMVLSVNCSDLNNTAGGVDGDTYFFTSYGAARDYEQQVFYYTIPFRFLTKSFPGNGTGIQFWYRANYGDCTIQYSSAQCIGITVSDANWMAQITGGEMAIYKVSLANGSSSN